MKKLYFVHSDGSMDYIGDVTEDKKYVSMALEDLYKRNPEYQSYYQRTWVDNTNNWIHIDVGSWSEEYIVKDD